MHTTPSFIEAYPLPIAPCMWQCTEGDPQPTAPGQCKESFALPNTHRNTALYKRIYTTDGAKVSKDQRVLFFSDQVCVFCNEPIIHLETALFNGNFRHMCQVKFFVPPPPPGVACENKAVCRSWDFQPYPPPPHPVIV